MKTEKISVQKILYDRFVYLSINFVGGLDCFISETSYLSGQYWNCICGCCSGTLLWNAS